MRNILIGLLITAAFLILVLPVSAAKKRVRIRATGVSFSSAKLSRATNSVILNLTNLSQAARVSYTLSYKANGMSQGVVGSIAVAGQATDSRDLYFGTCSKGVCTPHYGIQNASLLVTTTLKSGATNIKRYLIKI